MKLVSVLAAASLALAPIVSAAQTTDEGRDRQLMGVPPQNEDLGAIPEGVAAGAAIGLLVIGAGVGIGLAAGGGGGGSTPATGTTSTTGTISD